MNRHSLARELFVVDAIDALLDGNLDLAFYAGEGTSAGTTVATLAADDKQLQVLANGRSSKMFDRQDIARITKIPFSAGAQNTYEVDLTGLVGVDEGFIKVVVTTPGTAQILRKSFYGKVAADFDGIAEEEFSMSAAGDVVTVTAAVGEHISIAVGEAFQLAVVSETVAYAPPFGTPEHVKQLAEDGEPFYGITNKVGFPVVRPASLVDDGATYDIVAVDFEKKTGAAHGMNAYDVTPFQFVFACLIGEGSVADTLIAELTL